MSGFVLRLENDNPLQKRDSPVRQSPIAKGVCQPIERYFQQPLTQCNIITGMAGQAEFLEKRMILSETGSTQKIRCKERFLRKHLHQFHQTLDFRFKLVSTVQYLRIVEEIPKA